MRRGKTKQRVLCAAGDRNDKTVAEKLNVWKNGKFCIMFKDYFSDTSSLYGRCRPHYPEELFRYLATIAPDNDRAWDCACGTGQAAVGLNRYFREVVATDASESQIKKAARKPGVSYQVAKAESSPIRDGKIDLITVAQALHWFDLPAFFRETDRVLKHNGILAIWTYNLLKINGTVDAVIERLYFHTLSRFWPEERRMVENGYRDIRFPFAAFASPFFAMREKWDFLRLLGYLETWSAVSKFKKEGNPDELAAMFEEIGRAWGDPAARHAITWPLTLIIRRKP